MFLACRVHTDRKNRRIYIEVETPVLDELSDYSLNTMRRAVLEAALVECPPVQNPEVFAEPHHFWDFDEYEVVIKVSNEEARRKKAQQQLDDYMATCRTVRSHPDGRLPYA